MLRFRTLGELRIASTQNKTTYNRDFPEIRGFFLQENIKYYSKITKFHLKI